MIQVQQQNLKLNIQGQEIDDLCDFELKEIVDDIDKKGYSEHYYALEYDYRKYDIKVNNMLLKD